MQLMSAYQYQPLPPGCIRLVRLLPHGDEQAQIQCQLFQYDLRGQRNGTHLYEALSYYWGAPQKHQRVLIDGNVLHVTHNLHAAMNRLRDRHLERLIWTDAICIDQNNTEEKESQVRMMAEVYAKARCVAVWLEEKMASHQLQTQAHAESQRALESISLAADGSVKGSRRNAEDLAAIENLLNRAWFRRIWILQEVAAARQVLIMCQHNEVDGRAFCQGLRELRVVIKDDIHQLRVWSTSSLISAANLRRKAALGSSDRFSLDIRLLGELVGAHRHQEATDRRDKVYALLGMSIDTQSSLSPDYKVSWKTVFSRLITSLFNEDAEVRTWDNSEIAVFGLKGSVLGEVTSVKTSGNASEGNQKVRVILLNHSDHDGRGKEWTGTWTFYAPATSIQIGDVICFLRGSSHPSLIRIHTDYCAVIALTIVPAISEIDEKNEDNEEAGQNLLDGLLKSRSSDFLHYSFLLVWGWGMAWEKTNSSPGGLEDFLAKHSLNCAVPELAGRLTSLAETCLSLERDDEAIERFQMALDAYEQADQRSHPKALAVMQRLASTCRGSRARCHSNSRSTYGAPNEAVADAVEVMADLLRDGTATQPASIITEAQCVYIASICDLRPMEYILDAKDGAKVPITQNVLTAAAKNHYCGKDMLALLFDRRPENQIIITENLVKATTTKETLRFLLEKRRQLDQAIIEKGALSSRTAPPPLPPSIMSKMGIWLDDEETAQPDEDDIKTFLVGDQDDGRPIPFNARTLGLLFEVAGSCTHAGHLIQKLLENQKARGQIIITEAIMELLVSRVKQEDPERYYLSADAMARDYMDWYWGLLRQDYERILDLVVHWEGGRTLITEDAVEAVMREGSLFFQWQVLIVAKTVGRY